jgi:hypothetical protein
MAEIIFFGFTRDGTRLASRCHAPIRFVNRANVNARKPVGETERAHLAFLQPLTHLVVRGEATVEIEDDRFGHWPVALDFEKLVA